MDLDPPSGGSAHFAKATETSADVVDTLVVRNKSTASDAPAESLSKECLSERPPSRSSDEFVVHDTSDLESSSSHEEAPVERRPRPFVGKDYGEVNLSRDGLDTRAKVASDGRLNIEIDQKSQNLPELLIPALKSQLREDQVKPSVEYQTSQLSVPFASPEGSEIPPLNVVIHVVGSRGDVQPFVALGKSLKESYGHRVRLATHTTFKDFVEENGLEYFDIGGDPAELMAFMVKNPGLMPGMDSLRNGDVGKRRKGMYEILEGCWRSCFEIGNGSTTLKVDNVVQDQTNTEGSDDGATDSSAKPFVADAIIANPPSFAHIHCAERLGVPLHLMFTMPWSPTQAFPHPLANIQSSNADTSLTNFISYALVEMMTWQGLGDLINRFRERKLGLEPLSLIWAPGMASRLRIPYTYCWSPALIPKPKDWGQHISISGFFFLSLASHFKPDKSLEDFLDAGPPPIYVGFGSIVVDDPNDMTRLVLDAVKKTGQRALISKGWGGLGANALEIPDSVFMLGNVPHDWLFERVSCVVHHGGAGTTAAGIALGRPTVVVPFFGDQPFWGAMIAKARAGPKPVPSKHLTSDALAAAILEALRPETLQQAQALGAKIRSENGTQIGARKFHEQLGIDSLKCALSPRRAAVWRVKRTTIRLSAFAATTLSNQGLLDFNDLKLYRHKDFEAESGPIEPLSGGASAILGTFCSLMMGIADFPVEIVKAMRVRTTKTNDHSKPSVGSTDQSAILSQPESHQSRSWSAGRLGLSKHEADRTAQDGDQDPKSDITMANDRQVNQEKSTSGVSTPGAMASALHGRFSRSSSCSRSRSRSYSRSHSRTRTRHGESAPDETSDYDTESAPITVEAAVGAGKSIGRIVDAGIKSPMEFTLALARGFHNAPKLYGDHSVRETDKVTGIQSGLKAAGKEFGYGLFDGVTGLLKQPFDGARKEGISGLVKGFGKGVGGLIFKPGAAIWGLPGYTFKGIYQELRKHFGSSVENYIIAARTTQGFQEWNASSSDERSDVVTQWRNVEIDLQKQRNHHKLFHDYEQLSKHSLSPSRQTSHSGSLTTKLDQSPSLNPK